MKKRASFADPSGPVTPSPSPCNTMVGDFGLRRQLLLDVLVNGVARGVAEPMAVGVDDNVDKIRIVERGSRALVGRGSQRRRAVIEYVSLSLLRHCQRRTGAVIRVAIIK